MVVSTPEMGPDGKGGYTFPIPQGRPHSSVGAVMRAGADREVQGAGRHGERRRVEKSKGRNEGRGQGDSVVGQLYSAGENNGGSGLQILQQQQQQHRHQQQHRLHQDRAGRSHA